MDIAELVSDENLPIFVDAREGGRLVMVGGVMTPPPPPTLVLVLVLLLLLLMFCERPKKAMPPLAETEGEENPLPGGTTGERDVSPRRLASSVDGVRGGDRPSLERIPKMPPPPTADPMELIEVIPRAPERGSE